MNTVKQMPYALGSNPNQCNCTAPGVGHMHVPVQDSNLAQTRIYSARLDVKCQNNLICYSNCDKDGPLAEVKGL